MKKLILLLCFILISSFASAQLNNPTAYWRFNDIGFPTTINDSQGLMNMTANNTIFRMQIGKLNNSIRINNSALNVLINATPIRDRLILDANNFTIVFWINGSNGGGGTGFSIAGTDANSPDKWGIGTINGFNNITFSTNNLNSLNSPIALNGSYNRIAFVREGIGADQFKGYMNNINFRNVTLSGNFSNTTTFWRMSGANGVSNGINIDDFRIYNGYAWSVNDVATDWNNGLGQDSLGNIITSLNSPSDNLLTRNSSLLFDASATANSLELTNMTLNIWYNNGSLFNQTTNQVTGGNLTNSTTFNVSGISLNKYRWNVLSCGINSTSTLCAFATSNFTFTNGLQMNSESHDNPVGELSATIFNINLTLVSGLTSSDGYLRYNNTRFLAIKTTSGANTLYTKSVTTPSINNVVNVSWTWEFELNDGVTSQQINATNGLQQVNPLAIDDCAVFSTLILNYTLFDEDTRAIITPGATMNTTIELLVTLKTLTDSSVAITFNKTYNNTNPARVCFDDSILNTTSYSMESIAKYVTNTRVTEFNHIQNYTLNNNTIPNRINLYDLAITSSQEFKIRFRDDTFLPVSNAVIEILRHYEGAGQNLIVESPKTDQSGITLGHFVLSDVVYTINVKRQGLLISTFPNIRVFCQDIASGKCELNLDMASSTSGLPSFSNFGNLSYYTIYNQTSRTFTFVFSTTDSTSKTINMNMTLWNAYLNESVCFQSLTSSSGSLSCTAPSQYQNSSVFLTITSDGALVLTKILSINLSKADLLGTGRYILAVLIILAVVMLGISSGTLSLIFLFIGLVLVGMLNLIDYGGWFGIGSAFIFILFSGGVLLWKASRQDG